MADKTADDIIKQIKDEEVEYVDIRFCDLPGVVQHFSIPASAFDESVFEDGLAFDGSSVRGFQSIHESDMMLLPDPARAHRPVPAAKTLNLNFFVHDPFTREAYSRDPRNVARKAENYLASTGIADTAYFGAEAEFYIFDSVAFDSQMNGTIYEIDSEAGWWNTGEPFEADGSPNRGYKVRPKGGYFPVAPYDHYVDLRDQMCTNLQNAGFTLERGHHEVGTAGQAEINYKFNTLLHAADDLVLFKYIIKNTAWQAGKTVTFMPKPLFGDNGSGMHCPPVAVEGRQPAVPRRVRLRGAVGHGSPLHRRHPASRAVAAGVHQPDGELVQATGAGLRGADQPGVQPAQPFGVRAHPDHGQQPEGQAPRVPLPRQFGQPVPGVRGDDDGRHRRHQEEDGAAGADRQGPLRTAAGRGGEHPAGPDVALGSDRPPRRGSRIPHRGRGFHRGPDRDVDLLQA